MNNELFSILLVEDNAADVFLFRKALDGAKVNCELLVLSDGEMAMQFLQREGKYAASAMPDLAIVDARLPMYEGIDVLRAIRQSKHFANLRVVITSSSIDPRDLEKMEHLGVLHHFDKPSNLEGFFELGLVLKQILLENQDCAIAAATF